MTRKKGAVPNGPPVVGSRGSYLRSGFSDSSRAPRAHDRGASSFSERARPVPRPPSNQVGSSPRRSTEQRRRPLDCRAVADPPAPDVGRRPATGRFRSDCGPRVGRPGGDGRASSSGERRGAVPTRGAGLGGLSRAPGAWAPAGVRRRSASAPAVRAGAGVRARLPGGVDASRVDAERACVGWGGARRAPVAPRGGPPRARIPAEPGGGRPALRASGAASRGVLGQLAQGRAGEPPGEARSDEAHPERARPMAGRSVAARSVAARSGGAGKMLGQSDACFQPCGHLAHYGPNRVEWLAGDARKRPGRVPPSELSHGTAAWRDTRSGGVDGRVRRTESGSDGRGAPAPAPQ